MTTPLPEGYRERPPTRADMPGIVELLAASDRALIGEVDYHAEDLDEEWSRPRFDPGRDAVLIEAADGAVAGYAYTWESEPRRTVVSWAAPHPDHAYLYGALLDRIETRVQDRLANAPGERTWRVAIYESEARGSALLRERGFAPVRYFWRMAIPLRGDEAHPEPPDGIVLRSFRPDADGRAAHAVIHEAFGDHWGTPTPPFQEWIDEATGAEGFDAALWVLAEVDSEVAGVLTGRRTGDRGWIGQLGVRPSARGRGIAEAMLRESFARFAERGLTEAMLSVDSDNSTGATRLYERVGMRSKFRFDFYEKPLA